MAQNKIVWSDEAKADLKKILDFYIRRNGNSNYSKKLSLRIKKAVSLLKSHKHIGYKSDYGDAKVLLEGHYCIFYDVSPEEIVIVAIWDSRQDPELLNELFASY